VISHGVYCNWEYFLQKGFVPEHNPDNCYPGSAKDLIVDKQLPEAARRQALLDEADINVASLMLLSSSFSKEFELIARISSVDLVDEGEIRRIQAGRSASGLSQARVYEWVQKYAQAAISRTPISLHNANMLLKLTANVLVQPLFSQRARLALLYRITELELLYDLAAASQSAAEVLLNPSRVVDL